MTFLATGMPNLLVSQSADTIAIHAVDSGNSLLNVLSGIALEAGGAFTQPEADRVYQEVRNLAASPSNYRRGQVERSYTFWVQRRNQGAVLVLKLLSTRRDLFDVWVQASHADIIKAIRGQLGQHDIRPLIPIDRLRVRLAEKRSPGIEPHLLLALGTVKDFACSGYHIDHDWQSAGDTLHLNLHGVAAPSDSCPSGSAPADMSRELWLGYRRYYLHLSYRGITDRLILDVSAAATKVTGVTSMVDVDTRPRWRYPRNSFVLHCSSMEARLCGDIERWLPRQPGISRDSFPPGGINPYKPEDNTDRGRIFYRFDDASSFDRLGRCFRSIEDQIRETVGISVGLETWWGDEVRVSSRKAKHEPHIESPSRVTDTPACHKPLG